jgi:hypothetical protein
MRKTVFKPSALYARKELAPKEWLMIDRLSREAKGMRVRCGANDRLEVAACMDDCATPSGRWKEAGSKTKVQHARNGSGRSGQPGRSRHIEAF